MSGQHLTHSCGSDLFRSWEGEGSIGYPAKLTLDVVDGKPHLDIEYGFGEYQVADESTTYRGDLWCMGCGEGVTEEELGIPAAARPERSVSAEVFALINRRRVVRWHQGFPGDDGWTGADWSNAAAGEMGEAANVVKKLRRTDVALRGAVDPDQQVLLQHLADEIGDTYTYLDLLAQFYGLPNPLDCAVDKSDRISEREGLPERMPR